LTKNHRLVYDIVREQGHGTHLSMGDIHGLAAERRPGIGFTTIYRAIARLRDAGLVAEILLPGADAAVYEPAGPTHAHFRCTACGRVDDVAYAMPRAIADDLAARHDLQVDTVAVSLHGRCAACRT
jgi:Fe2+ or Zn2+ uptake regulation protein